MKDFLRTFLAVLLAGAILMVSGVTWWRHTTAAEKEERRLSALVDHTSVQLDELQSLIELTHGEKNSKDRQKEKAQIQDTLAEIISRIQSKPLDYPSELHRRPYGLQRDALDL